MEQYIPFKEREDPLDLCGCGKQHPSHWKCTVELSEDCSTYCRNCIRTCATLYCTCGKRNSFEDIDALRGGLCLECKDVLGKIHTPTIKGNCTICSTTYVQHPNRAVGIEMCPVCDNPEDPQPNVDLVYI